jgi:hypothetical protein
MTIISNKAKCNQCGDIVESKHRHDLVRCRCKNLAVDGGKDYLKRLFKEDDYTDLSEVTEDEE